MKLIKNDIDLINMFKSKAAKKYYEFGIADIADVRLGIISSPKTMIDYLNDDINKLDDFDILRTAKLRIIGEFLHFQELSKNAAYDDPVYNPENVEFLKDSISKKFDLSRFYLTIAELGLSEPEQIKTYLPDHEGLDPDFEGLQSLGANLSELSPLEEAKKLIVQEREEELKNELVTYNEGHTLTEQCFSKLAFDESVFQEIIEKKSATNLYVFARHTPAEVMDYFQELGTRADVIKTNTQALDEKRNNGQELDNIDNETLNNARINSTKVAGEKIALFRSYKDKLSNRSIFDYIFHPFRSYAESKALKAMNNNIKREYGLSDQNINDIIDVIDHPNKSFRIGLYRREDNTSLMKMPTEDEVRTRRQELDDEIVENIMNEKDDLTLEEFQAKIQKETNDLDVYLNELKKDDVQNNLVSQKHEELDKGENNLKNDEISFNN